MGVKILLILYVRSHRLPFVHVNYLRALLFHRSSFSLVARLSTSLLLSLVEIHERDLQEDSSERPRGYAILIVKLCRPSALPGRLGEYSLWIFPTWDSRDSSFLIVSFISCPRLSLEARQRHFGHPPKSPFGQIRAVVLDSCFPCCPC
jgi:hypothetical protein